MRIYSFFDLLDSASLIPAASEHLASDYLKEIVLIFFNCCNIMLVRGEMGRLNYIQVASIIYS